MTEETKKGGIKKTGVELEALVMKRMRLDLLRLPTAEARLRTLKYLASQVGEDKAAEQRGAPSPGQAGQTVIPGVPAPDPTAGW